MQSLLLRRQVALIHLNSYVSGTVGVLERFFVYFVVFQFLCPFKSFLCPCVRYKSVKKFKRIKSKQIKIKYKLKLYFVYLFALNALVFLIDAIDTWQDLSGPS